MTQFIFKVASIRSNYQEIVLRSWSEEICYSFRCYFQYENGFLVTLERSWPHLDMLVEAEKEVELPMKEWYDSDLLQTN